MRKHGERQRLRHSRLEAAGLRTKKDKDGSVSATDSETDDTASEPGEADSDDPRGPLPSSSSSVKRPFWQRGFSKRKSPASEGKDPSVPTSSEEVAPSAPGQLAEPTSADEAASGAGSSQDATALPELAATATESLAAAADKPAVSESQHELDVKLVAECLRVMTGLYFSHGTDITRSLQSKHDKADPLRHTPRWRSADRRFWFNENLMSPFVQAGVSNFPALAPSPSGKALIEAATLPARLLRAHPHARLCRRGLCHASNRIISGAFFRIGCAANSLGSHT